METLKKMNGWLAIVIIVVAALVVSTVMSLVSDVSSPDWIPENKLEWLLANWYYVAAFALASYGWWTNWKKYPWTAVVFYVLVGGFIIIKILGKLLNDLVGVDANGDNIIEGIFAKGLAQTQAFFIAIRDSELPLYQEPRVWVLVGIGLAIFLVATMTLGPTKGGAAASAGTASKPAASPKKGGSAIGGILTSILMIALVIGFSVSLLGGGLVMIAKVGENQQAIANTGGSAFAALNDWVGITVGSAERERAVQAARAQPQAVVVAPIATTPPATPTAPVVTECKDSRFASERGCKFVQLGAGSTYYMSKADGECIFYDPQELLDFERLGAGQFSFTAKRGGQFHFYFVTTGEKDANGKVCN
ncbi:hypothetical protein KC887_03435 [Candidatus Kaiserbacteria bacterium]|nr:hypothetical protein [Candidatus Kaiserbacteria bacterium]